MSEVFTALKKPAELEVIAQILKWLDLPDGECLPHDLLCQFVRRAGWSQGFDAAGLERWVRVRARWPRRLAGQRARSWRQPVRRRAKP